MRMRYAAALAAVALLAAGPSAIGQYALRDLGGGPSIGFSSSVPSAALGQSLGGNFSTADRFFGRPSPGGGSFITAVPIEVDLMRNTQGLPDPYALAPGPGTGPLMGLKVRTIDSLAFEKRGRFAKLREMTLALAERIREADQASTGQVSLGFRQFMFPMPLVDRPELGYGFFSQLDLVGAGSVSPEVFLAPFTQEVQQSLGEKKFQDAAQAMLLGRPLQEGMAMDQFYDTQLAAAGNFLFNNRKYAAAAAAWSALADRDKSSGTASRALALALLVSGQMPKAAAEVRRSLTLAQGWPDKTRFTGSNFQDVFPSAQDLTGVREELQAQLDKQPDAPDLNLLKAFVDLFQGNLSAAEERLGPLAAKDEVARQWLDRIKGGAVADSVRRPAQAALRRAAAELTGLEETPLSPEDRAKLIVALRSGPTTYEDYMRLGDFRFFMGDFTQASESYRAAHKARPEDAFALFALTHACFANGEYRQAVRYLEAALALQPNWGLYEFRLQEFYGDPDEYQRQLKDLQRMVELRTQSADMKFLLAYIYYFSGRFADATDLLAACLRDDPKFQEANYFLRLARLQG